jgi:hypothetical protein
MAQQNPVLDMMLALHEARFETNKKRLDYEQAQTREKIHAQGAVPSVYASLQASAEKKQKREQAIAKAGQQQQAQAQSPALLPSTVDVTGQTTGRDPMKAFKSATEIARVISGGGQAQQQGPLSQVRPAAGQGTAGTPVGGVFQQSGAPGQPQTGVPPLSPGPQAPQAPPPGAPQPSPTPQGQLPAGIDIGQGPPGSVVQITRDLPWWEQALYIGGGLAGIRSGNVGGLATGIRGKEIIGTREIPTLDEQAKVFAPGLSVLVARSRSTNPEIAQAAQGQLDQGRSRMEAQLGRDVTDTAFRQANDLWLLEDEQKRIREEQPQWQKAQLELGIEEKVAQGGLESLSPGERAIFERGRRATTVNVDIANQLQKSTVGALQKKLDEGREVMTRIDAFDEAFFAPGYEVLGQVDRVALRAQELVGTLDEKGRKQLQQFTDQESAVAGLSLNVLHPLIGSAMGVKEMERADGYIVEMKRGGTAAQSSSGHLREMIGLALFRQETVLESGSMVDPRYAMSLGNVKNAAREAIFVRQQQMESEGRSEAEAVKQVRMDFKNRYGLDVDRILGNR